MAMATEPIEQVNSAPKELLRPPVEGGTGHIQSLGRWIDDLMGHSKIEKEVKEEIARFIAAVNSQPDDEPQEPPAPDPPTIDPPKPVPGLDRN